MTKLAEKLLNLERKMPSDIDKIIKKYSNDLEDSEYFTKTIIKIFPAYYKAEEDKVKNGYSENKIESLYLKLITFINGLDEEKRKACIKSLFDIEKITFPLLINNYQYSTYVKGQELIAILLKLAQNGLYEQVYSNLKEEAQSRFKSYSESSSSSEITDEQYNMKIAFYRQYLIDSGGYDLSRAIESTTKYVTTKIDEAILNDIFNQLENLGKEGLVEENIKALKSKLWIYIDDKVIQSFPKDIESSEKKRLIHNLISLLINWFMKHKQGIIFLISLCDILREKIKEDLDEHNQEFILCALSKELDKQIFLNEQIFKEISKYFINTLSETNEGLIPKIKRLIAQFLFHSKSFVAVVKKTFNQAAEVEKMFVFCLVLEEEATLIEQHKRIEFMDHCFRGFKELEKTRFFPMLLQVLKEVGGNFPFIIQYLNSWESHNASEISRLSSRDSTSLDSVILAVTSLGSVVLNEPDMSEPNVETSFIDTAGSSSSSAYSHEWLNADASAGISSSSNQPGLAITNINYTSIIMEEEERELVVDYIDKISGSKSKDKKHIGPLIIRLNKLLIEIDKNLKIKQKDNFHCLVDIQKMAEILFNSFSKDETIKVICAINFLKSTKQNSNNFVNLLKFFMEYELVYYLNITYQTQSGKSLLSKIKSVFTGAVPNEIKVILENFPMQAVAQLRPVLLSMAVIEKESFTKEEAIKITNICRIINRAPLEFLKERGPDDELLLLALHDFFNDQSKTNHKLIRSCEKLIESIRSEVNTEYRLALMLRRPIQPTTEGHIPLWLQLIETGKSLTLVVKRLEYLKQDYKLEAFVNTAYASIKKWLIEKGDQASELLKNVESDQRVILTIGLNTPAEPLPSRIGTFSHNASSSSNAPTASSSSSDAPVVSSSSSFSYGSSSSSSS